MSFYISFLWTKILFHQKNESHDCSVFYLLWESKELYISEIAMIDSVALGVYILYSHGNVFGRGFNTYLWGSESMTFLCFSIYPPSAVGNFTLQRTKRIIQEDQSAKQKTHFEPKKKLWIQTTSWCWTIDKSGLVTTHCPVIRA